MFQGVIEPGQTLTIPNQQIPGAFGNLTLTNNNALGGLSVKVVLRLNQGQPQEVEILAGHNIQRGINDDSAVKNLGSGLIHWNFA